MKKNRQRKNRGRGKKQKEKKKKRKRQTDGSINTNPGCFKQSTYCSKDYRIYTHRKTGRERCTNYA